MGRTLVSKKAAEAKTLPSHALGLGLRASHYASIFAQRPRLDYFEIISENFMDEAELPAQNLARVLADYPVVMHGVGLNLLGHEALKEDYLIRLKSLADRVDPAFVSDHLCWSGAQGAHHHDLLPTPYTSDLISWAAERAAAVQSFLGRPFALENLSSYLSFASSTMTEWDFYSRVVAAADCFFMLDINNIYVSSQNHHFDPLRYIEAIDFSRVVQVHIAGHQRLSDGSILDTHDRPVAKAVWDLYQKAWSFGGPFPTLLEWDDHIPSLEEAMQELEKASRLRGASR